MPSAASGRNQLSERRDNHEKPSAARGPQPNAEDRNNHRGTEKKEKEIRSMRSIKTSHERWGKISDHCILCVSVSLWFKFLINGQILVELLTRL